MDHRLPREPPAEKLAAPVVRLNSEVNMSEGQPSPKRIKHDDGKDHVPNLRAAKPQRDSFLHDEEFDSEDSEGSGNTNESASADSVP